MVHTVCIDDSKHKDAMFERLRQMRQEKIHCDFIIRVQGDEYHAHRNILSAGSSYFEAMLKENTRESQDGIVEMQDVDSECVKSCIDFMYSGSFDVPDGKVKGLAHVAALMQLQEEISHVLTELLNVDSFYELRDIAEMYQLQSTSVKCKTFFTDNLLYFSTQPEFEDEQMSAIHDTLRSTELNLNEKTKLTICLRWVGRDAQKKADLFKLLKLIKLKDIPSDYIYDLVNSHPIISEDDKLSDLLKSSRKSKKRNEDKMLVLFDRNLDCLQSWDTSSDDIRMFHDEPFHHYRFFTAIATTVYIYVLCGNGSVHRLNFRSNYAEWKEVGHLIAEHGNAPPTASLSGTLYVIGAGALHHGTRDVEKFDPSTTQWTKLDDKPERIRHGTLVAVHGMIYCIGGSTEHNSLNTLCRFAPSTSEWVDLAPMNYPRGRCAAVAVEDRIFVMSGLREGVIVKDAESYNVFTGQWTTLSPMLENQDHVSAHYIDGWIFCVGLFTEYIEAEKYDIINDRWVKVELENRQYHELRGWVSVKKCRRNFPPVDGSLA